VADHDERPRGSSLVPVSSYHIPGLILGAGIEPQVYDKVTSQIDLMPTLFTLLGIKGNAPYIGQDIFLRPPGYPGRALMQFANNHAYMVGDQVVIHRPETDALQFVFRNRKLTPTRLDEALSKDALALALLPGLLYKNRWYRAN
jgi:phosphoglycerol transferase MdoB-like AlkP superfamily enzyme